AQRLPARGYGQARLRISGSRKSLLSNSGVPRAISQPRGGRINLQPARGAAAASALRFSPGFAHLSFRFAPPTTNANGPPSRSCPGVGNLCFGRSLVLPAPSTQPRCQLGDRSLRIESLRLRRFAGVLGLRRSRTPNS